jgi:hypothetical protein
MTPVIEALRHNPNAEVQSLIHYAEWAEDEIHRLRVHMAAELKRYRDQIRQLGGNPQ